MRTIKLQSSDGEIFEVDVEIAKASITIKTMLERLGMDGDQKVIPIPGVRSVILEKVIEWITYHHGEQPLPNNESRRRGMNQPFIMSPWDANFFRVDQNALIRLTLAANSLNIRGLLDLSCKAVARMMQNKSAREIRETFNIRNDFTAREESQLRKEIRKCEEEGHVNCKNVGINRSEKI